MAQPQGYYPPPGPPSQPYAPTYNGGGPPPQGPNYDYKPSGNETRFPTKSRINDIFFLLFFVIQFLAFAGLSGYVLNDWVKNGGYGGGLGGPKNGNSTGTRFTLDQHTLYLLLLVTAASVLLATTYLLLVRAFTKAIMHVTLVLSIALNIGICVYLWITKYYSGAIIFTIFAVLSLLSYFGFRSRIPFSSLLLQVVIDISKHHLSVYVVAFATLLIQGAWSVWYSFTVIATYGEWTPGSPTCGTASSCSSGKVAGVVFFLTFSYLWTSQVIANTALVTLAGGPYGSWYYFGPKAVAGSGVQGMPPRPTLSALARAFKSLGSTAFGSLIVTLIELVRLLIQAVRNSASASGDEMVAILACCAECLVGCIEGMVQYFNRYAYIEVALYGKSYLTAAKDTWHMFKDRGIDALVNDSLVGMTMTWGAYAVGICCALFAYLYLRFTNPSYNDDGQYTPIVLFYAFIIGIQCTVTMASAIEAGVSTLFVGIGEDPQVLANRAPELFSMIASRYPRAIQGVNNY